MAKITVCDICKSKDILTETNKYFKVKGRSDLRLDYCERCRSLVPKDMVEYTKFVYSLNNIELTNEEAVKMTLK